MPPRVKLGRTMIGKADGVGRGHGLGLGVDDGRFRDLQADGLHCGPELFSAFRLLDHGDIGGQEFDTVLFQYPGLGHLDGGIQRGLAAERRQQCVGPFLLDDLDDHLRGDRLDIGGVGQLRIGHDGGRVGVDQDNLVALLLQRLDRLGPGIIEFAGLADDDRPGADDENFMDIGSFRHGSCFQVKWRVWGFTVAVGRQGSAWVNYPRIIVIKRSKR